MNLFLLFSGNVLDVHIFRTLLLHVPSVPGHRGHTHLLRVDTVSGDHKPIAYSANHTFVTFCPLSSCWCHSALWITVFGEMKSHCYWREQVYISRAGVGYGVRLCCTLWTCCLERFANVMEPKSTDNRLGLTEFLRGHLDRTVLITG